MLRKVEILNDTNDHKKEGFCQATERVKIGPRIIFFSKKSSIQGISQKNIMFSFTSHNKFLWDYR